jgi:hypothetical protein
MPGETYILHASTHAVAQKPDTEVIEWDGLPARTGMQ